MHLGCGSHFYSAFKAAHPSIKNKTLEIFDDLKNFARSRAACLGEISTRTIYWSQNHLQRLPGLVCLTLEMVRKIIIFFR